MSLTRQLWLAVITSTILAFAGSFIVSMLTARNYLENQLAIKNRDNASSLALSITHVPKEPVNIELQVAAVYDSGQYEFIKLTDPEGSIMIEKRSTGEEINAPAWFVNLFPITSRPGLAQISDGWKQFASIELVSQRGYVYEELWRGALQLLFWFLAGGIVVGLLGSLMVKALSKPLNAVVRQADAISKRRFETIPLPRIPELKSVTEAMNTMVGRLKAMFEEEALRLEEVRREANLDKLTGLGNRSYFLGRLGNELSSDEAHPTGVVMILRIAGLAEINRNAGREITDNLLKRTGSIVAETVGQDPSTMSGRLNGSDFALLMPNVTEYEQMADNLIGRMQDLAASSDLQLEGGTLAQLGVTVYHHGENIGTLMARLDKALATAESRGGNVWHATLSEEGVELTSMDEWKQLIENAISSRTLKLVHFAVTKKGKILHHECPLRLKTPDHDDWIAAGSFMPMASRLRITSKLDLAAVTLALDDLKKTTDEMAVNISGESIPNPEFVLELQKLLQANPESRERLWLEAPEVGVFQHFDSFVNFCQGLRPYGCKIGVEHFGHRFSQIGKLHNLGLDYLKVDGSFVRNIDEQAGNQSFLKGLCSIAHNIGLFVIAEGVQTEEEMKILPTLGFDGVTGPAVRESN